MDGKDTGGWLEAFLFFQHPNERLPVLFSPSALWDQLCVPRLEVINVQIHTTLLAKVHNLLLALLHRPSVVTTRTVLACTGGWGLSAEQAEAAAQLQALNPKP